MDLFFDTTIHFDRIFKEKEKGNKIKAICEGKKLYSSIFVYNEFKKIGLNDVIAFHNLLADKHTTDPLHALDRRENYKNRNIAGGNLNQRVQKRIVNIFRTFCDDFNNDKEAILKRLQIWIEDLWDIEFGLNIEQPYINLTNCKRCEDFPVKEYNIYRQIPDVCTKQNPPECEINKFWKYFLPQLKKIVENNSSSDPTLNFDKENFERVRINAKEILKGNCPVGNICKSYLSDLIIALESTDIKNDYAILTTNLKDFIPFCKILNIKLKSPDD